MTSMIRILTIRRVIRNHHVTPGTTASLFPDKNVSLEAVVPVAAEEAEGVAAAEASVVDLGVGDHSQAEAVVAAVVVELTVKQQAGSSQAAHELAKNS